MLKDLSLPQIMDTSSGDLIADFFIPALTASSKYDRGVGYFSSGWLRMAATGMIAFASNGGHARWVTSPILDEADWEALQLGDAARHDPVLYAALKRSITDLPILIDKETLSLLSWMVADEIISFKLALPRNKLERGDFHDKFGIFTDKTGNQVSFNGSYNDSIQGTRNYESIKVFCSWHDAFAPLVKADSTRFERLWNNQDLNVRVFDLPEAVREQIVQLRTNERPYSKPAWIQSINPNRPEVTKPPNHPIFPSQLVLHDYQEEAIDKWFISDCKGLLEMATGTGKTITALAASVKLYQSENRLAVIISVPYKHLVEQWRTEAASFGYHPVLAFENKTRWLNDLNSQIVEFNSRYRKFISVITTHKTFGSDAFQQSIARLNQQSLLIADEAHHLGAEQSRKCYPLNIHSRLALSATPDRWFDDEGTFALRAYFGETVFEFPLEKAIGLSLTPYYYYPHLVPLTDDEMMRYENITAKIAKLANRKTQDAEQAMKNLLMRRAELLNLAENKLSVLSKLVDEQQERIHHTLFYCAPKQIDEVMHLLGWEKQLQVNRFTAEESTRERQQLLSAFASGTTQALVAMKCLDEGVDVPSTRTAFLLASSSNPREFIQRRGRILRKAPGKRFAVVHDLIAIPPTAHALSSNISISNTERNIVRRELQRFKEFADPALNKHQALDVVWDMARQYSLMDF